MIDLIDREALKAAYKAENKGEPGGAWKLICEAPAVEVPQWISVKERLPEPLQYAVVFACAEDGRAQIGIAEWCGNRWFSTQVYCNQDDIKYWMPLPELPKEERE